MQFSNKTEINPKHIHKVRAYAHAYAIDVARECGNSADRGTS